MRKYDGEDYKKAVVETIWNTTAKILQSKYKEFNIVFNPFTDVQFNSSWVACNAKRKILQGLRKKRKFSASALNKCEVFSMARLYDKNVLEGLHVLASELAWRGGEATYCKITYFVYEIENNG